MSHRSRVPLLAYMALIAAASSCDLGGPTVTAPADSVAQSGDLNASLLVRTTPGGPLAGLTGDQLALFTRGSGVFQRVFTPETGLGPRSEERRVGKEWRSMEAWGLVIEKHSG